MLPKFSMAASCLTITFLRAMRTAPRESVTDTTMGSSSGVSPTASATENRNDSRMSRCRSALTRKTRSTRKTTTCKIRNPKRRVPRSNSVSGARSPSPAATRPSSVAGPVTSTTAVPSPLTTDVPRYTAPVRSAASTCFSLGRDSPVRSASFMKRSRAAIRRASAGTRSPAFRRITSPTTTSRTGISRSRPSRTTVASWATCRLSPSAAACER